MSDSPLSVVLDDRTVEIRIRRSRRASHVRIRVGDFGAEVVLPWRAARKHAEAAVGQHRDWLRRALLKQRETACSEGPSGHLLFRGLWTPVETLAGNFLGTTEADESAVLQAMRRESDRDVRNAVEKWAPRLGVLPKRVSLRDQKSKWGACTSRGTVTFNWRLVMAPSEVLEYVVIHELAHLREMNHSPRFWAIVREHCPDYPAHKKWLRLNGVHMRAGSEPRQ